MLGRGPATPAHEAHAELEHAARVDAEILRRRHIDEALVDPAGQPGVGHSRHGQACLEHGLDGGQDVHRAVGAVDADDVGAEVAHLAGDVEAARAVGHAAVLVDRDLRDDGQAAGGHCAGDADGDAQLGRLAHGLDDERVYARLDQRLGLFAQRSPDFVEVVLTGVAEEVTARAYGTGDVGLSGRGGARELHAGQIELGHAVGQTVLFKPERVRSKRVGLDQRRAGPHVVFVHARDDLGARHIELFKACRIQYSAFVELRPHRPVDDENV